MRKLLSSLKKDKKSNKDPKQETNSNGKKDDFDGESKSSNLSKYRSNSSTNTNITKDFSGPEIRPEGILKSEII